MMAWKIWACQQGWRGSEEGSKCDLFIVAPEVVGSIPTNRTISFLSH